MQQRKPRVAATQRKNKIVDRKSNKLIRNQNRVTPGKSAPPTKKKQPYTNQWGSSKG